jgi:acetylornithine/N-succinyldiaminopimelate aminotransferase
MGLMNAVDIEGDAPAAVRRALFEQRLVVNATGPATIRMLPPLTIGEPELDDAVGRLRAALA